MSRVIEIMEKIWMSSNFGKFMICFAGIGTIWLIWKMIVESVERLANALSRITESLDHLFGRLVTLAIVLLLAAFLIYGAFLSNGLKGIKASQEGKSVSVEVKEK